MAKDKANGVQTEQEKVGYLIKRLREQRGMTQAEFAKALATSQSAVARMESGGQNLTVDQLGKIGEVLDRKIMSLSDDSVDFQIEGGRELSGSIETHFSKNGAVALIPAALLNKATTILNGIPKIEEVFRQIELMKSIGIDITWIKENTLKITPPKKFDLTHMDADAARKIRVSLYLFGALGKELKSFSLPHSGGCKMGKRTIKAHEAGFKEMGLKIKTTDTAYEVSHTKLVGGDITLYESSDMATVNLILLAAQITDETVIHFAQSNYMVQDVCFFLQNLGVTIEGIGTSTLRVRGLDSINKPIEYCNSEDPIESMMWIAAAIVTKSKLTITRAPIDFLRRELLTLEDMGLKYSLSKIYKSYNEKTDLVDITVLPSKLHAPEEKIHAQPYPGINTDNLPFFVPIATQAEGTTLIHDWMWENRAIYFTELNRLGAQVTLADPHRAFITGPSKLKGAQIVCPPALRPATIILIAMLGAQGTSTLRNVYSIKRGYAEIAERLNSVGAKIEVMRGI
jgi:UDP-N-acetylglucosamine 1-carboxyvinyltransferase